MYLLLPNVKTVVPNSADMPHEVFSWHYKKDRLKIIQADILIHRPSGKIKQIKEKIIPPENCTILKQYANKIVLPGFIDPHVHFRTPGNEQAENWHSGSLAALFGGITTVLDMPNTKPATVDKETLLQKESIIKNTSFINYGIFGGVTSRNIENIFKEELCIAFKVYMGSTTGNLLMENLQALPVNECLICFHAEKEQIIQDKRKTFGMLKTPRQHSQMRPPQAAIAATQEIIERANSHNVNFHVCHVSTPQEAEMLSDSKNSHNISWEAAPHHIFCSTENYNRGGYLWKCNPPLREKNLQEQLSRLLREEKIPMVATDHAPHRWEDKTTTEKEPASGIPSIQVGSHFILQEAFKNNISLLYASWLLSSAAALRFGLLNRGFIFPDYFADLTIIDPQKKWTFDSSQVLSNCKWTPFENFSFLGKVEATMVGGYIYESDKLMSTKERSQGAVINFLHRK